MMNESDISDHHAAEDQPLKSETDCNGAAWGRLNVASVFDF